MSEKIKQHHLERGAYVYVRQSTPYQVRNHLEGKELQYSLAERAKQLGFGKVIVIDEDLGRSGGGLQERPGFGRLLAAVCQGSAGAVFALEASRLARNNRDWHHLVDLCALTETLRIDTDGIYDPRLLNDRLLLGLKGSMAEFELGLLRQRAREAFEQKVKRGFALWEVSVRRSPRQHILARMADKPWKRCGNGAPRAEEWNVRHNGSARSRELSNPQSSLGRPSTRVSTFPQRRRLRLSNWRRLRITRRILRTVLHEIVVDSQRDSPRHRLILHWAGGIHTELYVERNPTGQHRRSAERTVINLVSELAKVCPDKIKTLRRF